MSVRPSLSAPTSPTSHHLSFCCLQAMGLRKRSRLERFKDRSPYGLWVLPILRPVALALEKEPILGLMELVLVLLPILIVLTYRDMKISQSQKAIQALQLSNSSGPVGQKFVFFSPFRQCHRCFGKEVKLPQNEPVGGTTLPHTRTDPRTLF